MKNILIRICALLGLASVPALAHAQADTLIKVCEKYMNAPYISDGQQYKTPLQKGEKAEFRTVFYGGSTYRVVGCSGLNDGNLVFRIYDHPNRNLLFTSSDYQNAPYWDFKFNSTMDCYIEAEIDSKTATSGFAILMIGFKP